MKILDIEQHLTSLFSPTHIEVIDESHKHRHHQGTTHTEDTHVHITIVSEQFSNHTLVQRHRMVNQALKPAFDHTLHAAQLITKPPKEWQSIHGH